MDSSAAQSRERTGIYPCLVIVASTSSDVTSVLCYDQAIEHFRHKLYDTNASLTPEVNFSACYC